MHNGWQKNDRKGAEGGMNCGIQGKERWNGNSKGVE